MIAQFVIEMDALANFHLLDTGRKTADCPYCGKTFHPAFYEPTPDQTFGYWQLYCSLLCRRLHTEENREERLGPIACFRGDP